MPDPNDDSRKIIINSFLERAERAMKGRRPADALKKVKAIVGAANLPPTELGQQAEDALDALRNMSVPTPKQLSALETIIRLMRPAPLSINRNLENIDEQMSPGGHQSWPEFKTAVKPFLYSIGRINTPPNEGVATGFLVAENLLVTNRHVLDQLSHGCRMIERGQATVHFGFEFGVSETNKPVADIIGVKAVHPSLDIALLEVDAQVFDDDRQPLRFDDPETAEEGQPVVTIGYPFKDARNPLFVDALFGNRFGVKRAALGEVMQVSGETLFHDCSTMGGNSGSPVLSMTTAKIVGLHRDGSFLYRNEAVRSGQLESFVTSNI